jgi:glutamate/tyrosine decarboxylase-like PLP-dependent enzyme
MRIPDKGTDPDELFHTLEQMKLSDLDWRSGRTWAYVYDAGEEAERVAKRSFNMFMSENALDPTVFPSLLRFENELVAMVKSHLNGGPDTVGSFSSGGTESIILAMKACRDHARAHRPEIAVPQVVLPDTAHAAFHKAAHYLGMETLNVRVDPETFKADVDAMREAITDRTVMIVGSAVSYAHGVVDPIEALGQLALDKNLWLHVDGCIGGFLLPYFERLGAPVPKFDLSVPGVTSLSVDLHKYAFAPKGASLVLYRDKSFRRHQIYACSNWSGYTIVNNAVQSTKSGGPMAAAWAMLHYMGDAGYLALAEKMLAGTRRILEAVEAHPDLRLLGTPEMNLVAVTSDTVNIFHVIDEMKTRGWYIQPQLSYRDSKENFHLSVNPKCVDLVEPMLTSLSEAIDAARGMPDPVDEGLLGMLAGIDPAGLDEAMFGQMLGMAGIDGVALPDRMAGINQLLNALPWQVREALLTEFINDLYRIRE